MGSSKRKWSGRCTRQRSLKATSISASDTLLREDFGRNVRSLDRGQSRYRGRRRFVLVLNTTPFTKLDPASSCQFTICGETVLACSRNVGQSSPCLANAQHLEVVADDPEDYLRDQLLANGNFHYFWNPMRMGDLTGLRTHMIIKRIDGFRL